LNSFEPNHIFAKFALDKKINTRGLIFCRFMRKETESNWSLQALGWGCGGKSVKDSECFEVCSGIRKPTALSE
jgi:hypothetical protein